jgi:hypothetical protein
MDQARSASATFTLQKRTLAVTKSGTGSGTVTSTPAGINCGSTCSTEVDYGHVVTLNAAAASGSSFAGFAGAGCSGAGSCVVTLDQARSVVATFIADPPVEEPPPEQPPTGDPPGSGPPVADVPLQITNLRVTPNRFRVSSEQTDPDPGKASKGTRIKVTITKDARVAFRVKNIPSTGGRDTPPPPDRPRTFRRDLRVGANTVDFSGTLLKRTLEPGRYKLLARAHGADGQKSSWVSARFRVLP